MTPEALGNPSWRGGNGGRSADVRAQASEGSSSCGTRVVVLTARSPRALVMLEALREAGVRIHAVVLDRGDLPWRQAVSTLRRSLRREGLGLTLERVARRSRHAFTSRHPMRRPDVDYGAFADAVHEIANPNSDAGVQLLKGLAPDLVVLGSSRIIGPRVIAIPTLGVLNAHPGLLPDYRGLDTIAWALRNGDPLGVTVHYVDPGIDTGDIVAQRGFDVRPGDTLGTLARHAASLSGELMAGVVRQLIATGHVETVPQPRNRGRTYTRMPPRLRRQVEQQLASRVR